MKTKTCALAIALTCALGSVQATLTDRGNGLVYDSDLDITWMKNASLSITNTFGAAGLINPTGTMSWDTARNWIEAMNAHAYLGATKWRLPTTLYPDASCTAVSGGHNCTGSEMGYLFYLELGGLADHDIATIHNTNYLLFQGIQSNRYWSSTGFTQAPSTPNDNAWTFYFQGGVQQTLAVEDFGAVWAVHNGDVASVPEVTTYAMMLSGLALFGYLWNSKRQAKYKCVLP
jgi:hypothetical protein